MGQVNSCTMTHKKRMEAAHASLESDILNVLRTVQLCLLLRLGLRQLDGHGLYHCNAEKSSKQVIQPGETKGGDTENVNVSLKHGFGGDTTIPLYVI